MITSNPRRMSYHQIWLVDFQPGS